MLPFFSQLLRRFRPAVVRPEPSGFMRDLEDVDIPRYPPFAKGLPVAPIGKLLETQRSLIEKIRQTLGLPQADFDKLVLPVLRRYAEFVHLMPASEAHHHRGAGGLFRHGLEVAFWTTQASGAVMFSIEGSPLERRNNEPRWRLASCFAGLLHDVGKPLSDVMVSDRDGRATWNPYGESLFDWAARHKIDRYFLRWRDNRHKRHEKFALLTVDRLIPQPTREYLADAGPQVIESMLEAIAGVGANQAITKLVLRADRESVSRDMKEHRLNVDEFSYGVPVERYIFDALRRLVKSGKWKINVAGGKVWVLQQGVFVIWKPVQDIIDLLAQDKTPGVPRDPDTLADILIERGFAHSCAVSENGDQAVYRYWRVLPDALKAEGVTEPMLMLRLDSVDLIVTGEPPVAVPGQVIGLETTKDGEDDIKLKPLEEDAAPGQEVATRNEAQPAQDTRGKTPDEAIHAPHEAGGDGRDETSEDDDGVSSALAAEQAANAALGGLGMDGLSMFLQEADVEDAIAPSNAELPGDGAVTGVASAQPERNSRSSQGTEEAVEPKKSISSMDLFTASDAPVGVSLERPGAVNSTRTAKRDKPKQTKVGGPAQPTVESSAQSPDLAPAPAPAAPKPASDKAKAKGKKKSTTNAQAHVQSGPPAGLAPQEPPPRKLSALQELMSLDYGLGVGVDTDMRFVDLGSPEAQGLDREADDPSTPAEDCTVGSMVEPAEAAMQALQDSLARYGAEAQALLNRAITPVLERKMLLGEVLYFQEGRLCILYPNGVNQIASTGMAAAGVIEVLRNAEAIVLTDAIPPRVIWNFDGIKTIVLNGEITSLVKTVFNAASDDFEMSEIIQAKDNSIVTERPVEYQAPMVDMRPKNHEENFNAPMKESAVPTKPPSNPVDLVLDDGSGVQGENHAEVSNELSEKNRPIAEDDVEGSPAFIVKQLGAMIIKGEGRWLASVVEKDSSGFNVDARSLEMIKGDYPMVNIITVKFLMQSSGMKIKKDRIYLNVEKFQK